MIVIGDIEAGVVLALAGGPLTLADLEALHDLSPGGARALVVRLEHKRLVRRVPDPRVPGGVQLRIGEGAEREVAAALHALLRLRPASSLP